MAKEKEILVPKEYEGMIAWEMRHYPKQNQFTDAIGDYWTTLFVAGNGAGKSHIFYWNLCAMALGMHPKWPVDPPLKEKVLLHDFEHGYGKIFTETCLEKQRLPNGANLPPMIHQNMVKKYPSRDDRTLVFKKEYGGSQIFFQTSEQKKRLHSGTNFDILGCDEEPEYQTYDESVRGLRTAKGGGRILFAFTPPFDEESKNKGPTWTKFQLVDPFEKGDDKDIWVVKAAMADNPAITQEYIRKFSKGKTEEQLRIQLYGEYPTWGRLIFPDFQDFIWDPETKMGNILPADLDIPWRDPDARFEMAVDWHGSKPCAIIWSYEWLAGPNKGDVVVFDELSPNAGKDLTISDTCTAIREIEGWTDTRIKRWGDPKMRDKNNALITGFSPWDEFRHNKIRLAEAWNRDPYVGYSIVNDFLRGKGKKNINHPRLFIRETCKTLIHNMKNHYNKPRGDGTADPDAKFSDYCVNLKYIMQGKSRKMKNGMQSRKKWAQTSYGANPVGPWNGEYMEKPGGLYVPVQRYG